MVEAGELEKDVEKEKRPRQRTRKVWKKMY